jgi:DNA-binding SARP family transcriptional activator
MSQLRLHQIGESAIEVGEVRVTPSASHLFSLLLYVCIERGRAVSRAELSSLLFPNSRESDASHNLRQLVYRAKRLGAPLQTTHSALILARDHVSDDLHQVLESCPLTPDRVIPGRLQVLPDYAPPTERLDHWLERHRDLVRTKLVRALSRDLESFRAAGDWQCVEQVAAALLEHDPFNETATLCLAEALARVGSKRTAIDLLRKFEGEVGKASSTLAIPPRLLARRIAETIKHDVGPVDTRIFGRDKELERLSTFWTRTRSGHFTALAVIGTESIGKSRLAMEFASSVRLAGTGSVVVSRRSPLDAERPLSLFADIVRDLLALRGAAGCWPQTLTFLNRLTRTRATENLSDGEQPDFEYSNAAVRRAVTDLFDSVLSEQAIALILDDAEHLDEASLALLNDLRRRLTARPCLLILVSRAPNVARLVGAATIRLGPLGIPELRDLAGAVAVSLGRSQSSDGLERSVSLAAGNPGHLRLLLLDKGPPRGDSRVPNDLIAAIDARVGTLSPKALHLLQSCAVFGAPVSADAARQLTGLRGYSLLSGMQELEDAALVASGPDGTQCASTLIEERVRMGVTPSVAALLHHRAAQLLVRKSIAMGITSQAISWTIAEHWTKAGEAAAALHWRQRCWQQLLRIGQPLSAVEGIRFALAQSSSPKERAELLTLLAAALRGLGDFLSLTQVIEERIALSNEVDDPTEVKTTLAFDLLEAKEVGSLDLNSPLVVLQGYVANPQLDPVLRLRAARLLMIGADHSFDHPIAESTFETCRDIHPSSPSAELLQLLSLVIYHTSFGDRSQGIECAQRLLDVATRTEPSWGRIAALRAHSIAHRVMSPAPAPYETLETAFRECTDYGVQGAPIIIAGLLATYLFDDGEIADAKRWGDTLNGLVATHPRREYTPDFFACQIDLALHDGDIAQAQELVSAFAARAPQSPRPRLRRELLVYKARVDQFAGLRTAEADLAELWRLHTLGQSSSRHDDNVEVLWVAFHERGMVEQASLILSEYLLRSRREVRRCNYWLRTRTARDLAWTDPGVGHLR